MGFDQATRDVMEGLFGQVRRSPFTDRPAVDPLPQERPAGDGNLQAVAWLRNATADGTANVTIDSTGITILDGALTLKDVLGNSILTASGFAGTWSTFIANGLYNSNFLAGTIGAITSSLATTSAPFWLTSFASHASIPVIRALTPAGRPVINLSPPTFTGATRRAGIKQPGIPVSPGTFLSTRVMWRRDTSSGHPVGLWATASFYDAAGTDLAADISSQTIDITEDMSEDTWRTDYLLQALAPDNAVTMALSIEAYWSSGATSGDEVEIAEVALLRGDFGSAMVDNSIYMGFYSVYGGAFITYEADTHSLTVTAGTGAPFKVAVYSDMFSVGGTMYLLGPSGVLDLSANLYRSAAATLKTDGALISTGQIVCGANFTVQGNVFTIASGTAPSAASAGTARLFVDTSGGKVRFRVQFPTGAAITLATQV